MSSKSHDWCTPQWLWTQLDYEFHFTLDAAATAENAKCDRFFTAEDDALLQRWDGIVWCNPPYGAAIPKFVAKGYEESLLGATVVMLLPARTGTPWFHDYAMKGEVRFLRGRLRFDNPKSRHNKNGKDCAPFDSVVVVWKAKMPEAGSDALHRSGGNPISPIVATEQPDVECSGEVTASPARGVSELLLAAGAPPTESQPE